MDHRVKPGDDAENGDRPILRILANPNAKTRRAFLRTGFERGNSLWTKHHG
jgi:hypothetical protein